MIIQDISSERRRTQGPKAAINEVDPDEYLCMWPRGVADHPKIWSGHWDAEFTNKSGLTAADGTELLIILCGSYGEPHDRSRAFDRSKNLTFLEYLYLQDLVKHDTFGT